MSVTQYGFHDELVNRYEGALNGGITDSSTSLTLTDATGLPTAGLFRLLIEDEILICSGRSGNVVSIFERGAESTAAAAHSDGEDVTCVLTNQGLQRYLLSTSGGRCAAYTQDTTFDDSHAWPIPLNRATDESLTTLTASDFSWHNQGTATLTDSAGGFKMTCPSESGWNLRGVTISRPTPPYAFSARFRFMVAPSNMSSNTSSHWGLWIRDSGGKLLTQSIRAGNAIAQWEWNDWNTYNSFVDTALSCHDVQWLWVRLEDDNTDIKGFYSLDGSNWSQDGAGWWQQSRTNHLASGGNAIGFYLSSASSGGSGSGNSGSGPAVGTIAIEAFHVEEM